MTEQEHLECEIEEYKIELERHELIVRTLEVRIEKKKRELEELKMKQTPKKTLYDIIYEWKYNAYDPTCEELVSRIVDWLPNEYVSYGEYNEGWNDCLKHLKENLR